MKKTYYEAKILSRNRNSAESGRSMVEMLGVLAIVGVISIGGIAGYNYGMNRYRTNEVLDGASKRAYTVATQMTLGLTPNLSEFKECDATAGGTFQTTIQEWDGGEFGIQVNGVKKEVCENILRMMGDNTTLRAVTKSSDEKTDLTAGDCDDGDNNDLYLVYNTDMLASKNESSTRTGGGSGGNCWVTETCGSDNIDPDYEEYCNGRAFLKGYDYCPCWNATHDDNECAGALDSYNYGGGNYYQNCRKAGKSAARCYCEIITLSELQEEECGSL